MQLHASHRNIDQSILRELFLERLLLRGQHVLTLTPASIGLTDVAEMADKLAEVKISDATAPTISQISQPATLDSIVERLDSLEQRLSRKDASPSPSHPSHPRYTQRPRSISPKWCYYHRKFGKQARCCESPCLFSGNGPARQ